MAKKTEKPLVKVTMRFFEGDVEKAKAQAEKTPGMSYQILIRDIVHEHFQKKRNREVVR